MKLLTSFRVRLGELYLRVYVFRYLKIFEFLSCSKLDFSRFIPTQMAGYLIRVRNCHVVISFKDPSVSESKLGNECIGVI